MFEKLIEKIDMVIEIIKGDDPVLDQIIEDDFEYHYACDVRYDQLVEIAKERGLIKK